MSGQGVFQSVLKSRFGSMPGARGARLLICGKAFIADVSGALYWPVEETLIVSDLCLDLEPRIENYFPPDQGSYYVDDHEGHCELLIRLQQVIEKFQVKRLVILGGLASQDPSNYDLVDYDLMDLQKICAVCSVQWVYDGYKPEQFGFLDCHVVHDLRLGGLVFRHKPVSAPLSHEIAGGLYPMARVPQAERISAHRCFVSSQTRLVMPSFSHYAPCQNILSKPFDPLFPAQSVYVWTLGFYDVYPVTSRLLLED